MSEFILTRTRIRAGLYQGLLTTRAKVRQEPELELRFLNSIPGKITLTPDPKLKKTWTVSAEIPAASISEGVQTYILSDKESGKTLDSFAIIAGSPLQEDLRAEIALLRGELDILKQAFRSHCVETSK